MMHLQGGPLHAVQFHGCRCCSGQTRTSQRHQQCKHALAEALVLHSGLQLDLIAVQDRDAVLLLPPKVHICLRRAALHGNATHQPFHLPKRVRPAPPLINSR